MKCPECNGELPETRHYKPGSLFKKGLPEDWYSYGNLDGKPQDGGYCALCFKSFITIKNGAIYTYPQGAEQWKLFRSKTYRVNRTPIGGRWIQ